MTNNNIIISVLFPVSHGDQLAYFKKSIYSIINQNCNDFRILLCIDGKIKDEINKFIEEAVIVDIRNICKITNRNIELEILRNETNIGLAATLNRAIKKFPSDIYFRMDADDISKKERLQKTIDEFNRDEKILLVGTECIEIDKDENEIFYKKMPYQIDIQNFAYTRNPFIHPSVAFKKEFIEKVGYYNETFLKSQDYELWARAIIKNIKMNNIHEPLIYFRIADKFWQKRTLLNNIINESKVSWELIKHFKAYSNTPKLLMKIALRFFLRIAPASVNKFVYNLFR